MRFWLMGLIFLLTACESPPPQRNYIEIKGRDTVSAKKRLPLYRIQMPQMWEFNSGEESVIDTTLPILEAFYQENGETIRLTVHNFPYQDTAQRIPALAQISRWKQQFDVLQTAQTTPQAFAGFAGFHLYAEGLNGGVDGAVSAWAMELAPEHERTLSRKTAPSNQTRSDITIKAVGPKDLMAKQQEVVARIARSFELINPLPNP